MFVSYIDYGELGRFRFIAIVIFHSYYVNINVCCKGGLYEVHQLVRIFVG